MFQIDTTTGNIQMHAGDTGAFAVRATRKTGESWTDDDRCLFTVRDAQGNIVMQRLYKLNDAFDLGDGVMLFQFHNNDTDKWAAGSYSMERRYDITPYWDGTPPEGACVNALTAGVRMVEGNCVRTPWHGTLTIQGVLGDI